MKRKASAEWQGDLKSGKGTVSSESGVLAGTPYSFSTRFESVRGTNPEELVAAPHAACFTLALSAELGRAIIVLASLRWPGSGALDRGDSSWTVSQCRLQRASE